MYRLIRTSLLTGLIARWRSPLRPSALALYLLLVFSGLASAQFQSKIYLLPQAVQDLIYAEQKLISRELDERVIATPKENYQDPRYAPENGEVFQFRGYWLAKSLFNEAATPNSAMPKDFRRSRRGQPEVLFLVHPESEEFFKDLTAKATETVDYYATSTSSSRTILAWAEQGDPFFAKLSLAKEIGGVVRTIPSGEVARSIGTAMILEQLSSKLPESFLFMRESYGLMPKGMERGGMIIREISDVLQTRGRRLVPLFSLYAKPSDGGPTLLEKMVEASGRDGAEFFAERILTPFIAQWTELQVRFGISMEPHAQNVLLELDRNGMPTGRFVHRDFGGFNIDLEFARTQLGIETSKLPTFSNLNTDYHQKFHRQSVDQSLGIFFKSGFLYNITKLMRARGVKLTRTKITNETWNQRTLALVNEYLAAYTGADHQLKSLDAVSAQIVAARNPHASLGVCKEMADRANRN